jgi:membrane protein
MPGGGNSKGVEHNMLRAGWRNLVDAYNRFLAADGLALAGNIAFCMILALFPFLIFLTALAGFFGNEALAEAAVEYLLSAIPGRLAQAISPEIHAILTRPRTDLLTIAVAFTLWTASGAVESVRVGLNRAYGYAEMRPYWFRLAQNIGFVLAGAAVLLVLAISLVVGPLWWDRLAARFETIGRFTAWFYLLRYPVALALMTLTLFATHLILPLRTHAFRELWPGILTTIILWLIAAWGYSTYLAHFSTLASLYGSLTGIIIALTFLYLSGALIIWGGQVNQVMINRRTAKRKTG